MVVEADFEQAGGVEITNVSARDISFVDLRDIKELFDELRYEKQKSLVVDFLDSVNEDEFKRIINQTNHKI